MLKRPSAAGTSTASPAPKTSFGSGSSTGNFYLALLVAQNTSKTLVLRYAVSGKPEFLYSAAVLATESLKALLSIIWVLSHGGTLSGIASFLRSEWRTFLRVLVPAGVYNCQQMLEFVALSRLDAPVFSVLVQSKLLTTALFSYLLLGRKLARKQVLRFPRQLALAILVTDSRAARLLTRPPFRLFWRCRRPISLHCCCSCAASCIGALTRIPPPATPHAVAVRLLTGVPRSHVDLCAAAAAVRRGVGSALAAQTNASRCGPRA